MSNFVSPDLSTSIPATKFKTVIEQNFSAIQQAFDTIQNELPGLQISPSTNTALIDRVTRPNGIIGTDSFQPILGTDHSQFRVGHNIYDGVSSCVISNRYHETRESFAKNFEAIGITASGDYVVKFGLKTRGAPIVEMFLELDSTDLEQDLTVWKMDVNRNVGAFTVTNLRRVATVLISRDTFEAVRDRHIPLTFQYPGVIPATFGRLDTGILVPWNCEVERAFVRLETPPAAYTDQSIIEIQLSTILGTDATNVLASTATFDDRDGIGKTVTLESLSEPYQLRAGEYVYPLILQPETVLTDFPAQAAGLTVTLLVRQIDQDVLR